MYKFDREKYDKRMQLSLIHIYTSFLEFQSRVRDTFLRYATKWKFVIIDAK